jgi:UDP-glucose 4-epimerase
VLEAAIEAKLDRVVWTSSTVVYGPAERYGDARVDESAPTGPLTFYGLTKVVAEEIASYYRRRHELDVVGLRLPLVLGPGLWYAGAASAIAGVISAASPGARHAVTFHDDPMDLMHVADVADAVVAALDPGHGLDAIYNINGFTARLSDLIAYLQKRVPGYLVDHHRQPAALRFPLIDDARFREATSFTPARGLATLVDDMLRSGRE